MVLGLCRRAINAKVEPIDIPSVRRIGEVEGRLTILKQLIAERGAVVLIGIGPEVEPYVAERVGRMIVVGECQLSVECMGMIVEGDVEQVAQILLPIGLLAGAPEGGEDEDEGQNSRLHGQHFDG